MRLSIAITFKMVYRVFQRIFVLPCSRYGWRHGEVIKSVRSHLLAELSTKNSGAMEAHDLINTMAGPCWVDICSLYIKNTSGCHSGSMDNPKSRVCALL